MAKTKTNREEYRKDTVNIWFPNQREPDPQDREAFKRYWKQEKRRIKNGFWIADKQVHISGWLYWYTVYWVIERDIKTPTGRSFKGQGTPTFRDIEWEFDQDIAECERLKKMYCLVGSRGFGKSNLCASLVGHIYNFWNSTECLITGGFNNDIKLLADKINLGLSNSHPVFHKQRILDNWKQEVKAGWRDQTSGLIKGSNSRINVRNYEEGNNTMAANGCRPKVQIIDEIGKIPNLVNCVLDTVPCWMNEDGMFSIPILAGTGGDMEKGADAAQLFRNPRKYDILEFDDQWEGSGKIGKFVPVTKALNQYKEPWTLYRYLTEVRGMTLTPHPDLDVTIMVSNEERALEEFVKPRRARAANSTTAKELIKEKAYYPLTPSESFLVISSNDFPVEVCKQQYDWLEREEFRPLRVELFTGLDGTIQIKDSDKSPVTDFPVKSDTDKEGVIEMVERPIDNPPMGLYVAGIDPYKVSESDWSDSLGAVVIWKRMTTNMGEPFQDMPVCWYTGRPKSIHEWYNTVRMLLKLYNAKAMCENADYGFIQYMIEKNETLYLAEGQTFLREISPSSQHKGTYGLPPTIPMINHWNNTLVKYVKEEFTKLYNAEGKPIETRLGVTRILDRMLLEEMMKFNKDPKFNADRVRAAGIAVSYARQLDALMPKMQIEKEWQAPTKVLHTPFGINPGIGRMGGSPFLGSRRRL